MTENEKLIEAAKMLKEHCAAIECDTCHFHLYGSTEYCALNTGLVPEEWKLPQLRRWTDEDIALAKALKAFGVFVIERPEQCRIIGGNERGNVIFGLREDAFAGLRIGGEVAIDDIIADGETAT